MISTLLFDFSRVILLPKDKLYTGGLNALHKMLSQKADYTFSNHFELNSELLMYLSNIKNSFDLYLFTNETIQEQEDVKPFVNQTFQKVYTASALGMEKSNPDAYKYIAADLGKDAQEMLFIDDSHDNVTAAHKAGLQTLQFKSNQQLLSDLHTKFKIDLL